MTILRKSVSLNPDESKAVTFTITPTEPGTYHVGVDGLVGSFVALAAPAYEFVYASDLIIVRTDYPTKYDISWEIAVQNIGAGAGIIHLSIAHRMDYYCGAYDFSSWREGITEATIAPGETKILSGAFKLEPYCYQIKAESEAGIRVKYWYAMAG